MIFWAKFVISLTIILFAINLVSNLWFSRRLRRSVSKTSFPSTSLSVIIPARNEASNLKRLLPSLAKQNHPNFEVIVYDDLSSDDTAKVVEDSNLANLKLIKGGQVPNGWLGKVHALYQSSKVAQGETFLFLDADTELLHASSLSDLANVYERLPRDSAFSGLPRLDGGGILLISLLHFVILVGAPWLLSVRLPFPSMTVLNGQLWMITSTMYRKLEPHLQVKEKIIEDVEIGRYLKKSGVPTYFADIGDLVSVFMYSNLKESIHGLSKNAYLLLGGKPLSFVFLWTFLFICLVLSPILSLWFLLSIFLLKMFTDRIGRLPFWLCFLAPLTMMGASLVQLYSALLHWTGGVTWKNRTIK